jgi:serine phosphatase RsbU (regulator of sigma subunit)
MRDVELQQKCYRLLSDYYGKQGNLKKSTEYKTQLDLLIAAQEKEEERKRQINRLEQTIEATGQEKQITQAKLTEQSKKLLQSTASLRMAERSLRTTTDYLQATTDSLQEIEAISRNRQMEIDLLQKNKELTDITIKEQETRFENEALFRNSVLGGSLLSIALVGVLIVSNRKSIKANRKIKQQNKNIKSSINYAKRIQEAMLPKAEHHPSIFQDSFILFKPRDTVSGDFYWISEITKKGQTTSDVAFAAVDCTGHGVPGALMSMIGINALNSLANRGITESNLLLDSLDHEIRTALQQEISGINDGMDVALCIYRQKEKVLEFSGAQNPLVYIQNDSLIQIKGDAHSIGGRKKTTEGYHFKKHQVVIDTPTVVYLFSDGYKDQFGGTENRKFLTKKLHKLLLEIHHLPMPEQMNTLQATIDAWKGEHDQTDDILVMGIRLA